jgi:hypothetical protein
LVVVLCSKNKNYFIEQTTFKQNHEVDQKENEEKELNAVLTLPTKLTFYF